MSSKQRLDKFHGNISSWIELADIHNDYFTLYVKSWIAFNAWFSSSYSSENTDSAILNKIKNEVNPFRNKIIYFLSGTDDESINFRKHIGNLYDELEKNEIPSIDRKITFKNIVLEKNTLPYIEEFVKGKNYSYKIKVSYDHNAYEGNQKVTTDVLDLRDNNNPGRMNYNQNEWNVEELKLHPQFKLPKIHHLRIKKQVQKSIVNCYLEVNPSKPTNLLIEPRLRSKTKERARPNNCIVMDSQKHIYFINEPSKIVSGLISILYDVRNKLFHGEINPSLEIEMIYKEAYFILYPLIKILKVK